MNTPPLVLAVLIDGCRPVDTSQEVWFFPCGWTLSGARFGEGHFPGLKLLHQRWHGMAAPAAAAPATPPVAWRFPCGWKRAESFWVKVNKEGPIPAFKPSLGPCWIWTGGLSKKGYGVFSLGGVSQLAHRVAYEWILGAVPAELELDHLCRVRACVRPNHLEAVTHRVNLRRAPVWKDGRPVRVASLS